ncbi:MAG: ABC transporter permease [Burkholderiaceae bacterium]
MKVFDLKLGPGCAPSGETTVPGLPRSARPRYRKLVELALLLGTALIHGLATAQMQSSACGSTPNPSDGGYGPYDYRTDRDKLQIVERPHFPPVVEALIGTKRAPVGGDLDYTLRAFPNHHRALNAAMRYGEKLKTPHPGDMTFPVECYFDRALRFRPDDNVARMLYAQFLERNQRTNEALVQLARVESTAGDNAFTHYNLGMLYADMKEYDKAVAHAHEAYRLGFGKLDLRDKLATAGKWTDPKDAAAPANASDSTGKN